MNATNNFSRLTRGIMIAGITLVLNMGCAQSFLATAGNIQAVAGDQEITFLKESVVTPNPAPLMRSTVLDEMNSDPAYWVSFLRGQVTFEESVPEPFEAGSALDRMMNDPCYWPNYLKAQADEEENGDVISEMETDPLFWKHYLDATVDAAGQ